MLCMDDSMPELLKLNVITIIYRLLLTFTVMHSCLLYVYAPQYVSIFSCIDSTIQIDFYRGKFKNAYELPYCWINWFKLEKITAVIIRTYIRLLEKDHSLPTLESLEEAAQIPPDLGLSLSSEDEDISLEARIERLNSRLLSLAGVLPPNVKADLDKLLDDIDDLSSISSDENTSSDLSEDSDDELAGQRRFN